jgi:hypothetical protein
MKIEVWLFREYVLHGFRWSADGVLWSGLPNSYFMFAIRPL